MLPILLTSGLLSGYFLTRKSTSTNSLPQSYSISCSYICNSNLTNLPLLLIGQGIQFKSIITHGYKDPFSIARQIKIGGCFGNDKNLTGLAIYDMNIKIAVNYLIYFNKMNVREGFNFLSSQYLEFLEKENLIGSGNVSPESIKDISSIQIESDIKKLFVLEPTLKFIPSNILAFNIVIHLLKNINFEIMRKCFKVTELYYSLGLGFEEQINRFNDIISKIKMEMPNKMRY